MSDLAAGAERLTPWYHTLELPGGLHAGTGFANQHFHFAREALGLDKREPLPPLGGREGASSSR